MGGLFGIGGGSSKTDRNQQLTSWGTLNDINAFTEPFGEKNLTTASNFFNSILSGDMGQISKTLAPEISTITGQAEQQKKTNAEFGNRAGGTNSANQALTAGENAQINSMIDSLLSGSASALASIGLSTLQTGQQGIETAGQQATNSRPTDLQQGNLLGGGIASLLSNVPGAISEGLGVTSGGGSTVEGILAGLAAL